MCLNLNENGFVLADEDESVHWLLRRVGLAPLLRRDGHELGVVAGLGSSRRGGLLDEKKDKSGAGTKVKVSKIFPPKSGFKNWRLQLQIPTVNIFPKNGIQQVVSRKKNFVFVSPKIVSLSNCLARWPGTDVMIFF
jgi:hypothetical protein